MFSSEDTYKQFTVLKLCRLLNKSIYRTRAGTSMKWMSDFYSDRIQIIFVFSAVHTARKKLASRPGGSRSRRSRHEPISSCRNHPRWPHDFDHGEVVGLHSEAALRPPFPAGEAAGHDPAVLEPYAVQCLRHDLRIVTVPALPIRHVKRSERQVTVFIFRSKCRALAVGALTSP